jgi:hypothetical protein
MKEKNKEIEKTVKVNFTNPEGKMQLKIKGTKAVDHTLKIMQTFDEACSKIREEDQQPK